MSKALVTGGAGFIGSHLVDKLMEKGFEVVVLDNFSTGNLENLRSHLGKENFCIIRGDVRNKADVKKAAKDVDYIFHLAAIISVELSIKNPSLVNEVNVYGTLNILEESLKLNLKRFVYLSSCAVYGNPVYLPIDEEHPTKPLSPYGVSKLTAEHYCRIFYEIYGVQTVCLRLFNVYGPRQSSGPYSGVITKFVGCLKRRKPLVIFGDGEQTRDFIYVDDVIDAILSASESKKCSGEIINIGSGKETSINELAKILVEIFGYKEVKPKYANAKPGDIRRSCANLTKAKKLLNFKPKISLEEGLRRVVAEACSDENCNG